MCHVFKAQNLALFKNSVCWTDSALKKGLSWILLYFKEEGRTSNEVLVMRSKFCYNKRKITIVLLVGGTCYWTGNTDVKKVYSMDSFEVKFGSRFAYFHLNYSAFFLVVPILLLNLFLGQKFWLLLNQSIESTQFCVLK